MIAAKTDHDLEALLEESKERPVLLFKHSTRCSISSAAKREMEAFEKSHGDVPIYVNLVVEDRPIADRIAKVTGVTHESPQAFVIKNGKVVWNASHGDIYLEALESEINSLNEHQEPS